MNGSRHVSFLWKKLQLHMAFHKSTVSMHSGAPCYRSKVVKNFLGQQRISILEGPGRRSGLNLIENLWSLMKRKVTEKQPSSFLSLQRAIKEVWIKMFMHKANLWAYLRISRLECHEVEGPCKILTCEDLVTNWFDICAQLLHLFILAKTFFVFLVK